MIAYSGEDVRKLANHEQVHESFGTPTRQGTEDGRAWDEYYTRRKISEEQVAGGCIVLGVQTFGLLELVMFPSLVQRMQAVASGDVDIGNGGLSATMQVATKGFPMQVLANGCDGGWMVLCQPSIGGWKDLVGKKIAVQNGSIGLVSLNWKLKQEGIFGKVEMAFMDNQDQPIPLMRGDVGAICVFEPYAALAELNGWGKRLWVPYDSPMGKTNLGFVASEKFVKADPELTKKMVQAHVKATQKMASDSSIAIETTIKQFKMTREVAELSVKNLFFSAESGAPFVSGLKALAKMMIDDKMLEKEPDWGSLLNLGYV